MPTFEICVYFQVQAYDALNARLNITDELESNTSLSFEILDDAVEEVTSELS